MILNNKIIIVTGGSGLLGKEMINNIVAKGGIAINVDINVEDDLSKFQCNCNITSPQDIEKAVQNISNHFGRIDGLVNNAYPRTSDWGTKFEDIKYESWQTNVDWQLNSYFYFCQQVLKIMRVQKSGSVINIASIYGVVGNDLTVYENTKIVAPAAYSAIKGGLVNFSRYLASYYGEFGVRVNCVSPGGIFDHQDTNFVSAYEKKVPLKRMGNPEDIAPSVSFLLSEEAKYITGQNLIVDGGWTIV
jgi:NAD(P)-dependent dehydrogenase (short-subunit alcohol dehydrogenase family)